jgi:hypothetical protein
MGVIIPLLNFERKAEIKAVHRNTYRQPVSFGKRRARGTQWRSTRPRASSTRSTTHPPQRHRPSPPGDPATSIDNPPPAGKYDQHMHVHTYAHSPGDPATSIDNPPPAGKYDQHMHVHTYAHPPGDPATSISLVATRSPAGGASIGNPYVREAPLPGLRQ